MLWLISSRQHLLQLYVFSLQACDIILITVGAYLIAYPFSMIFEKPFQNLDKHFLVPLSKKSASTSPVQTNPQTQHANHSYMKLDRQQSTSSEGEDRLSRKYDDRIWSARKSIYELNLTDGYRKRIVCYLNYLTIQQFSSSTVPQPYCFVYHDSAASRSVLLTQSIKQSLH